MHLAGDPRRRVDIHPDRGTERGSGRTGSVQGRAVLQSGVVFQVGALGDPGLPPVTAPSARPLQAGRRGGRLRRQRRNVTMSTRPRRVGWPGSGVVGLALLLAGCAPAPPAAPAAPASGAATARPPTA